MPKLKRVLYGLPVMRPYRAWRTHQLARRHRRHPSGFLFAGRDVYFRTDWEPHEQAAITNALGEADVFLDVGANQGIYSCMAAARGMPVAAIEPEAGNLRFLLANAQVNGFANLEIFATAVAREPGVANFYGDGDMASLVEGWHQVRSSFSQLTPVNTLDNLFADRWAGKRLLVKIDVEGAELEAVEGARRLLARDPKPVWLIETFLFNRDATRSLNTRFGALFELLFAAGYACTRVDTGASVTEADVRGWLEHPATASLGLSNFLFHG